MNSLPQGSKSGKRKHRNGDVHPMLRKKSDSPKKSVKHSSKKVTKQLKSKEKIDKEALQNYNPTTANFSPKTSKKKNQVKMKSSAEKCDSKSSKTTRWDSVPTKASRWDQVPPPHPASQKATRWEQGQQSYPSKAWSQWGPGQNGHWDQQGYGQNQPFSGYNGYGKEYGQWGHNGYVDNGYDQHWGYDKPQNPLNHLYKNHMETNNWKTVDHPSSKNDSKTVDRSKNGLKNKFVPRSTKPSAIVKPKRPMQSIEEIKRQKREEKELNAAQMEREMANQNIADRAAKLRARMESMKNQGSLEKVTFSTGHWSPSNKEEEIDRPQPEMDDLNLTPGELAQIGRGKNVCGGFMEEEPPPMLPVYVNCLAAAPSSIDGEAQERARVANNPAVAKIRSRSRTMSESNNREVVPAKRIRKMSIQLPETIFEKEVHDIDKFKQALLKMNKRELSELVNSPTSNKSKLLMSGLVRDHRRIISQRLHHVRFNCTSKMLVHIGENLDSADSLLEVDMDALPLELMVHISDMIKMEVPEIEIIAEKLTRSEAHVIPAIKKEIKREKSENGITSIEEEVIEVPVPPKPTPLLVDLEHPTATATDGDVPKPTEIEEAGLHKTKRAKIAVDQGAKITIDERAKITIDQGEKNTIDEGAKIAVDQGAKIPEDPKTGDEMDTRKAKEAADLIPFEGLRRERKRGRPKNGEIRKNLGQEIVIGTVDGSDKGSSDDGQIRRNKTKNRKRKSDDAEPPLPSDSSPEDSLNGEADSTSNEKNLRLIFEEESRLWSEFKTNREILDEAQANEINILQRMEFLNELKRQMFKF